MSSYTQPQWPSWAYTPEVNDPFSGYTQYNNNYSSYLADSMEAYQTHHHHHLVHNHQMSRTTESKPRLSKEEVELLEAEFQKNHKPNSTVKKGLAESMRVDNARINNWFQNRRAREKKEKNIREYEARQKLEQDPSKPESGDSAALRKSDLVASSAPFPNTQTAPSRSHTGTPDGSSSPASLFQAKETPVSDSSVILPSTELSPQLSPELTVKQEPGYDDVTSAQYGQMGNSELLADNELSPNALSDSHEQEFMLSAGGSESGYYMSQLNGSAGAPFQASGDFQTANPQKPSQIIDIASRRNRRPPPLAINGGSRSHSTGLLKTGVEMGRRLDVCNSIRRVASSTGPMRVQKPVGTPRSPFFSRAAGDGIQLRRSPVLSGIKGSNAPPTPDTPVVIATQSLDSAHPDSDSDSSDRFSVPDMAIHDPTLRTPPTTPGVMEGYFSLNAVYDMQMPSDGLLTPSLATYSNNLDVASVPIGVPAYIANPTGCSSQPVTPSLPPHTTGGYFGITNSNAEYQWPDHSSRNSSPVRGPQQPQFMNMTTSSFSPSDR